MDDFDKLAAEAETEDEFLPTAEAEEDYEPEGPPASDEEVHEETESAEPAPEDEAQDSPPSWQAALRQGETPEQGVARLVRDVQRHKERASQLDELKAKQAQYDEFFQKMKERLAEEQKKKEEADLPDEDLEPERRALYELRQFRREQAEKDRQERERQQQQMTEAQRQEAEQALQAIDQHTYQEIATGLGQVEDAEPDPEFQEAFEFVQALTWNDLVSQYGQELRQMPQDEAQHKAQHLMHMLRLLDGRHARASGMSYKDYILRRYRAQPEPVREGMKRWMKNNGRQERFGGPQQGRAKSGGPTAAEVEKQAKNARKSGGLRRTTGSGGVSMPDSIDDILNAPEDQQEAMLKKAGMTDADIWHALADDDWGAGV